MSRSGRKRVSKWDMKEEHQTFVGGTQYWPRRTCEPVHNEESESRRHSPQLPGSTVPEHSGVESISKDDTEFSDTNLAWHGNGSGSYSSEMSPGLDDWRHRSRSPSGNGLGRFYRSRSRSPSRSPPNGFKRGSGLDGRSVAAQTCRDFASGRCRRGDRCPFVHQDARDDKDRRCPENQTNSRQSRHRSDGASRYSSSEYSQITVDKGSPREVFKERESDRSKYGYSTHSRDHESHRGGDIPCKFFAAGNCRNGKFCRFSHNGQTATPDDRSGDSWRWRSSNLEAIEQQGKRLKWSDTTTSGDAKLFEWKEDINGNFGSHEQIDAACARDDRWMERMDTDNDKAVDGNERNYFQPTGTAAAGTVGFEPKGAESWFDDMEVSSPWQSSGQVVKEESGHISKTSDSLTSYETSVHTYEQVITGQILDKHQVTAATPPLISENTHFQLNPISREDAGYPFAHEVRKATSDCAISTVDPTIPANVLPVPSFVQIGHSSNAVIHPLSRINAVGHYQQTFRPHDPRVESVINPQNQLLYQDNKSFSIPSVGDGNKPELTTEIPQTENLASKEQLSQFTNLSALAQLLNLQQLSHLGMVPNIPKPMEFVSSSHLAGPINPHTEASTNPNPVIESSERQYDPLSDSIELIKCHIDNPPPGSLPNPVEGKDLAAEKLEVLSRNLFASLSGGPSGSVQDKDKTGSLELELDQECHQLEKLNPLADCHGKGKNGAAAEESKKAQENEKLEKINGEGRADEGKKKNDAKGIRAFKFALVELVKEILKPKWKEGQISTESHRAIAKKVVDKVTGSVQGAHIPQSKEKIDNYLSSSKPKLTKLVEAYVEKLQKN